MGSIKRRRKRYSTPEHPWRRERIDEERKIVEEYALVNKKEIWKQEAILKRFFHQAKRLINLHSQQAERERKQLLDVLVSLRLLDANARAEDVLSLDLRSILNRRLQTLVFKKGLARSMKQARQFIIHRHIMVNNKMIGVPSYLVRAAEEDKIAFYPGSNLADEMHPERKQEKKEVKSEEKKPEPDKEKKSKNEKKLSTDKEKGLEMSKTSQKEKPLKKEGKEKKSKDKKEEKEAPEKDKNAK